MFFQVIKMLLAVIGIFLLCWGPKLVLNLMKRHHLDILHSNSAFAASVSIQRNWTSWPVQCHEQLEANIQKHAEHVHVFHPLAKTDSFACSLGSCCLSSCPPSWISIQQGLLPIKHRLARIQACQVQWEFLLIGNLVVFFHSSPLTCCRTSRAQRIPSSTALCPGSSGRVCGPRAERTVAAVEETAPATRAGPGCPITISIAKQSSPMATTRPKRARCWMCPRNKHRWRHSEPEGSSEWKQESSGNEKREGCFSLFSQARPMVKILFQKFGQNFNKKKILLWFSDSLTRRSAVDLFGATFSLKCLVWFCSQFRGFFAFPILQTISFHQIPTTPNQLPLKVWRQRCNRVLFQYSRRFGPIIYNWATSSFGTWSPE